jgi:hypothetical protein
VYNRTITPTLSPTQTMKKTMASDIPLQNELYNLGGDMDKWKKLVRKSTTTPIQCLHTTLTILSLGEKALLRDDHGVRLDGGGGAAGISCTGYTLLALLIHYAPH